MPLAAFLGLGLAGFGRDCAAQEHGSAPPANPAEALEMPTVEVVGTTPLPGLGTAIQFVPANVQIYTSESLSAQRQTNLTDFLEQNATSVTANDAQGNPFQPDILFRGFTASPLLGTPEGVSVFQDGVRINEPFGDIVNWDLIPESAIAGIQLIPGSNPAFGLNTLGGALAVYTKSGAQYPGLGVEVSGGSFGRRTAEAEWGGTSGRFDFFITANYFDDNGWADHNPSRVEQLFAKVGWQTERTNVDVSFTAADNELQGTQTLPLSFLGDFRQAYTYPDTTSNRLQFVTVRASQFLSPTVLLGGTLYYRHYATGSFSSNTNGDYGTIDPVTGALDTVEAINDNSLIDQNGYGGGVQLTLSRSLAGLKNQLIIGASADLGDALYTQYAQNAAFTPDRGTYGIGPYSVQTDADSRSAFEGLFFSDTLNLSSRWALTLAGRYNRADIRIEDRSGAAPQLNGEHIFTRFNPAIGVSFNPTPQLTTYFAYNEGARAPTAIELTCADPSAPCSLPNDFVSDPSLKQVIARTLEIGARGTWLAGAHWSAAAYRTRLENDIEFISSVNSINAGYYANVGSTQRQGIELSADARWRALRFTLHYDYIDATFRSTFSESSPANSTADAAGAILVEPGDRLPGIPRQTVKLRVDAELGTRVTLGMNLVYSAPSYARGDENNLDRNGEVPGYALVSLDAHYRPSRRWELFARVNNLLDRRYSNFGVLAANDFTGPQESFGPAAGIAPRPEQFRGPGAPIGAWIGASYQLAGTAEP